MNKPGQGGSELHVQEKWHIASRNGGRPIICENDTSVKDYRRIGAACRAGPPRRSTTKARALRVGGSVDQAPRRSGFGAGR
jgi:hypothetical protein